MAVVIMTTAHRWMSRVAELPCQLCGAHGVQVHHVRAGQGMSQRANDFLTIACCPECHTGPLGIHGDKSLLRIQKLSEMDLLARTIAAVFARLS